MPTLYDVALSPFAQKVKIALLEKAVDYDTVAPVLGSADPAFLAVSPKGEVPALVDGDLRLFDSSIILQYLEEKWPTLGRTLYENLGATHGS